MPDLASRDASPHGLRDLTGDAETWLRSEGLPFFVQPRNRASFLVPRISPFLVFVLFLDVGRWMLGHSNLVIVDDSPFVVALVLLTALTLFTLFVAVPAAAFALTARLLRRHPRPMRLAGWLVLCYYLLVDPWVGADAAEGLPLAGTLVSAAVATGALAVTWLGVGALVSWAIRAAVRRLRALGQMTTRALPLLMLVVVLAVFNRTLWEVTNAMPAARLAGVVLFFVLLGLLFIVPVTQSEMRGLDERIGTEERATLIRSTRLSALLPYIAEPGPPLGRTERLNITLVLVLAQGFQVAIVASVVCVFLTVLGELALSPQVLEAWLGVPASQIELLGLSFTLNIAVLKTAVFLSCVTSLNFIVSAASGAAYKSAFYDPLFIGAHTALAVRSAYLALQASSRPDTPGECDKLQV
ncbi:hypothetical protein [Subtercola vilae]|uniref:Uncharacterized protein n=1 Tax=Subtercola vilae TaxID=2056433 RepID=A0A4T2BLA3_9MICO|nr:hypothetical protein [Subtercola vilae]TIH32137.1 hypothetical protein D4765_16065 [Subtercola vilae]